MNPEDRYDSLFVIYGDRFAVPWKLLKAQVKIESDFNPDAVNPKSGATGLAQFMPRTWEEWRDGTPGIEAIIEHLKLLDPRDPEDAIKAQAAYMDWLIRHAGNGERALAAYNWGIGNLKKCIATHGDSWREHLPEETRDYITKVMAQFQEYQS
jgi:soluble lytic murein transglycosylase-like protein